MPAHDVAAEKLLGSDGRRIEGWACFVDRALIHRAKTPGAGVRCGYVYPSVDVM